MKFRVLFLKKKHLLYILVILILLFIIIALLIDHNKTSNTFNTIKDEKSIKADFTGDGEEDTLYINTKEGKYYVEIKTKGNSLFLKPNKKLDTLGTYYEYWPMKINISDITRDKLPEIFIQSSQNNVPVQHVFCWNGIEFKDIFCSNNNIMGFLDSKNSKTPKFISGNFKNGTIDISYNMLIGNDFKNYSYDSSSFPGKSSIINFIDYIQSLPQGEAYKPDVFYDGLTGKDLALIGKMSAENNSYIFQDAFFCDNKYDKNGNLQDIKWTLSFKAINNSQESKGNYYSINLLLKPCPSSNNEFKIYSLNLSQK